MHDLAIWRRLVARTATIEDVRALEGVELERKVAYIAHLVPLVLAGEPAMRAAALRALAGARGVPGVREIVARLDDDHDDVRAAALDALRKVARGAPYRFVHALFHPRSDVRRAALDGELPIRIAELAMYLRSDPECADLIHKARWPDHSFHLALDFYAAGQLPAKDFILLFVHARLDVMRTYLTQAHARSAEVVDGFLETAARDTAAVPPGHDVLDRIVAAIAEAGTPNRALDHFVEVVTPKGKNKSLPRRAVLALLQQLAREPNDALWAACVALEPRLIGSVRFTPALTTATAAGLFRHHWPTRPGVKQIERLLSLPVVREDLALAAAIAGLLSSKRLDKLAKALGEDALLARLVASDHGWDEICRLPPETPALETAWLQKIEKQDYKRYIALAGRALGGLAGQRLDSFVEQMPRRHRPGVFLAALEAHGKGSDERVTAVGKAIAARVDRATLVTLLQGLLPDPSYDRMVHAIARASAPKLLASAVGELTDEHALRVVAICDAEPIPHDRELAIANILVNRKPKPIIEWRAKVEAILTAGVPVAPPPPRVHRALLPAEAHKISTCPDGQLTDALAPVFGGHISGVSTALATRKAGESVVACNALLGCADPLQDVANVLDRFTGTTARFHGALDDDAVLWVRVRELPVLAHARLWRWEAHTFALLEWVESIGSALGALQITDALQGRLARETLWKAISEAMMLIRYRHPLRFKAHATVELAHYCANAIDDVVGRHAARILVALVEGKLIHVSEVRDRVLDHVSDADAETREYIARLIRLEGLPQPPRSVDIPAVQLIEQLRRATYGELVEYCRDPRAAVVQEAALALVVLGPEGELRLAALLDELDQLAQPVPLLQTIQLWEHPPAIAAVHALANKPDLPPAWQFHLALNLYARGEADQLTRVLAAVRAPSQGWFFRRDDWDALVRHANIVTCSLALADAPHHHAYQRAVNTLLSLVRPDDDVRAALVRFLEIDAARPLHLRVDVARFLAQHWNDATGVPLLVEYVADERADDWMYTLLLVPKEAIADAARTLVAAALAGGNQVCSEKRMWQVMQHMRANMTLDIETQAELDVDIFEQASTTGVRRAAASFAIASMTARNRLRRVADVFAWGIRRGVELAGRLFRIHMTAKERELGHTKLDGNQIFVSPLPMLRAETHGQDVVEGLLLHEIGHHVYHRSPESVALWNQAHKEGIGHFLNLIADEHLERNLRAVDPSYGDRLKRLDAYAFQHAPQEIKVAVLFDSRRTHTARAFMAAELGVAFDEESVRVRRGAILGELDRLGHPVARFSRALRMGLGNRSGDPLVEQALALCGKDLRTLDMKGLYELTKKLVELFGGKHECAKVFGGPEGLVYGERDEEVYGAGIDDDVLQREVERILDPRRSKTGGQHGKVDRLQINVNPSDEFDRITRVIRVNGNAELHKKLAHDVQRHSTRLRAHLDDLGLRWEPVRARTQGRALDRTRLIPLVTRNDPRILVARTPIRKTDLFLGTLVDCSSSMSAGQNIERAKKFAVLVAEAVRTLHGVEARFFGFTSNVIYDAGSAHDCGVVGLAASGGNNDAAALYHAANVAMSSKQRAKVLVMISDGLPTECSVNALRALVKTLTKRRNIVCAQVAVRDLEEVCFPHYVVLDDSEPDVAVAKFGRMIGELARRSLSS